MLSPAKAKKKELNVLDWMVMIVYQGFSALASPAHEHYGYFQLLLSFQMNHHGTWIHMLDLAQIIIGCHSRCNSPIFPGLGTALGVH